MVVTVFYFICTAMLSSFFVYKVVSVTPGSSAVICIVCTRAGLPASPWGDGLALALALASPWGDGLELLGLRFQLGIPACCWNGNWFGGFLGLLGLRGLLGLFGLRGGFSNLGDSG